MNAIHRRGRGPSLAMALFAFFALFGAPGLAESSLQAQSETFKPGKIPDDWLDEDAGAAGKKDDTQDAERRKAFATLLGKSRVLLLRVDRAWHPKLGSTVQKCGKGWLALEGKEVHGFFPDSMLPADAEIKAKQLDLTREGTTAWLTPGLVDADSRWFRDPADLNDRSVSAMTEARTGLATWQEGWEELVHEGGLTKVWVPAGLNGRFAGQGALVDIHADSGPRLATRKSALQIQISSPGSNGNNLLRTAAVDALEKMFEAAGKHREAKEKFEKELKEYAKKRKEFLAYYKKNPLKPGEKPAAAKPTPSRGRSWRPTPAQIAQLRKLPPRQRIAAMRKMAAEAQAAAKKKEPEKKEEAKKGDSKKAPPRPKYPKEPKENPLLDELLEVLDGNLPLRIEAHRAAEIRALLRLLDERGIRKWTLLGATEALPVAKELRQAGARVVLRPGSVDERRFDLLDEHVPQLAAKLAAEGVEVSIASGSKRAATELRLLASRSVAWGMPEHTAIAAISSHALRSTPGGGSEDLVLWSGNPLGPDARPVAVIRNGKTIWSAAQKKGESK